jgi:hypothetical protein
MHEENVELNFSMKEQEAFGIHISQALRRISTP